MHEGPGNVYPRGTYEIERDQSHYVGDAEPSAGDEEAVPQRFVHNRHGAQRSATVQFRPLGDLIRLENFGGGMDVPISLGDGVEKLQLQPPVPHFDARAFERADAETGAAPDEAPRNNDKLPPISETTSPSSSSSAGRSGTDRERRRPPSRAPGGLDPCRRSARNVPFPPGRCARAGRWAQVWNRIVSSSPPGCPRRARHRNCAES